uniref:Ufm1-specific protease n=1 Tax=Ascaris suum TaxID=6253 RepID=F1L1G0_ASCSU
MPDEVWSLDFSLLFENYENVRKWCKDNSLLGFVVGDANTKRIVNILFNSLTDFNAACDLARFIESSFSAEVSLLGILSLMDVEYAFDVRKLGTTTLDAARFVHLSTNTTTLLNRDFERFIDENSDVLSIRQDKDNATVRRAGILARACHKINFNIRVENPDRISEELSKAFALEAEVVDTLCFLNAEKNVMLSSGCKSDISSSLFEGLQKPQFDKNHAEFVPLIAVSSELNEDVGTRLVPIVKIKNGPVTYYSMKTSITGYTIIRASDSSDTVLERLREALRRALFLFEKCTAFSNFIAQDFIEVESFIFFYRESIICVYYPRSNNEALLRGCRSKLHRVFNLSFERPLLRPSQAVLFNNNSALLRDPHLHILNYKPKGKLSLVKGHYDYHHYMQDGIDDTGWGCAYRSLQTIWSWLVLQGYTNKAVPSHREIQESLYECGDKDAKFVGSRQWIGSMELGYCLDNMLGIQSRIINTNSGAEVADNVRQLALHFDNSGTPVMIGGGMLAHTIIGVDFNDSTGECAFLVLDPHYTGEENMSIVVSKGWCGWKAPSFWKQEHFYNLLLPQPPANVI